MYAEADQGEREGGDDPMDVRVRCPAVPEEAACQGDEGGKDGGWETAFWDRDIVIAKGGALVVEVLDVAG